MRWVNQAIAISCMTSLAIGLILASINQQENLDSQGADGAGQEPQGFLLEECRTVYMLDDHGLSAHISAGTGQVGGDFKVFSCHDLSCLIKRYDTLFITITAPLGIFDAQSGSIKFPHRVVVEHADARLTSSDATFLLKTLTLTSSRGITASSGHLTHESQAYTIDLKKECSSFEGGVVTVFE